MVEYSLLRSGEGESAPFSLRGAAEPTLVSSGEAELSDLWPGAVEFYSENGWTRWVPYHLGRVRRKSLTEARAKGNRRVFGRAGHGPSFAIMGFHWPATLKFDAS